VFVTPDYPALVRRDIQQFFMERRWGIGTGGAFVSGFDFLDIETEVDDIPIPD